jgi:hypothetical protein
MKMYKDHRATPHEFKLWITQAPFLILFGWQRAGIGQTVLQQVFLDFMLPIV